MFNTLNGYLKDEKTKEKIEASVSFENGKILIGIKGYGDSFSKDGCGSPIMIDYFNNKLQVVVWSDINEEEPTHLIDLKGAKESNRIENHNVAMASQDDD